MPGGLARRGIWNEIHAVLGRGVHGTPVCRGNTSSYPVGVRNHVSSCTVYVMPNRLVTLSIGDKVKPTLRR